VRARRAREEAFQTDARVGAEAVAADAAERRRRVVLRAASRRGLFSLLLLTHL
jgi:hypothetical protein